MSYTTLTEYGSTLTVREIIPGLWVETETWPDGQPPASVVVGADPRNDRRVELGEVESDRGDETDWLAIEMARHTWGEQ